MPSRSEVVYCWSEEPAEIRQRVLTRYKYESCGSHYTIQPTRTTSCLKSQNIKAQQFA